MCIRDSDIPESERKDFYLYVDEFQNFATESFANILSEARKYHLNLIIAHQYIEQLDEKVRAAVFGNVGTIMCFRVGAADAEFLAKEFYPTFTEDDLLNLTKFNVYLKLMIDGVASEPFSAITLPPLQTKTNNREKIIKVSRERYGKPREIVESKIVRWTGVEEMHKAIAANDNKYITKESKEYPESREKKILPKRITPQKKPKLNFNQLETVQLATTDSEPISLKEAITRSPQSFHKRRDDHKRNFKPQFDKKIRSTASSSKYQGSQKDIHSLRPGQIVRLP